MSSLEPCNVVNSKDLQQQFESEPIRSDKGPASLNLTPAGYCVVVVVVGLCWADRGAACKWVSKCFHMRVRLTAGQSVDEGRCVTRHAFASCKSRLQEITKNRFCWHLWTVFILCCPKGPQDIFSYSYFIFFFRTEVQSSLKRNVRYLFWSRKGVSFQRSLNCLLDVFCDGGEGGRGGNGNEGNFILTQDFVLSPLSIIINNQVHLFRAHPG